MGTLASNALIGNLGLTRKQYVGVGLVALLVGIAEFAAVFWFAQHITARRAEAAKRAAVYADECVRKLNGIGMSSQRQGDTITASKKGLQDAALRLGEASAAALMCPGWQMTRFCMGEGCPKPGEVWLELQPVKRN